MLQKILVKNPYAYIPTCAPWPFFLPEIDFFHVKLLRYENYRFENVHNKSSYKWDDGHTQQFYPHANQATKYLPRSQQGLKSTEPLLELHIESAIAFFDPRLLPWRGKILLIMHKYKVGPRIGKGGFGVVYIAQIREVSARLISFMFDFRIVIKLFYTEHFVNRLSYQSCDRM